MGKGTINRGETRAEVDENAESCRNTGDWVAACEEIDNRDEVYRGVDDCGKAGRKIGNYRDDPVEARPDPTRPWRT
jgi:hypothetical protein